MITAPRFWWRRHGGMASLALAPISAVWSAVSGARMRQPPVLRAPLPVICIGNFVVGGAGKTPTALAVADIVKTLGFRPGFLTRGYGGRITTAHLVDLLRDDAALVGDEALLLAERGPVVVAPDRPKGVPLLEAAGVDCIIMDDGFQNPSLAKDFGLVVVDGVAGIGNGKVMPAGPLRAPLKTQLVRTDAVLIVGAGEGGDQVVRLASRAARVILRGALEPDRPDDFRGGRFLAFAGIGRPEKFFASLEAAGAVVAVRESFPDHRPYTEADAARLLARAAAEGLRLVTTAKDHVRLRGSSGARLALVEKAEVFGVRMHFADDAAVARGIAKALHAFGAQRLR
ncbi:lipid-A-disaccharide kinase [Kaistia soli DSM 19436]|uniref:Tetraacyldisaccharide 4'-kinase n=1 Tax=Kaistia soli DSM 19436 TaxID=1122133 RepID=A0A1M4W2I4_9HYPH|nr:tetraacyldisaccharide 4'-kinase [Kaistia soli]SHE75494.1 lipid-A-disaccharide kinase [Kaistia soli DSM 19436]